MFWRWLLRKLATVLLVASLLPGLPEILEHVEHLLHDGHLPHSAQHEAEKHAESHGDALGDEHGCTPLSHHCGCHASVYAVVPDPAPEFSSIAALAAVRPLAVERSPAARANAPPTPPPISERSG